MDLVKTVVILISVVLMPGLFVIICVVSPCRLRSRMWRRRRRSRETLEHSQLRPNSQGSEVSIGFLKGILFQHNCIDGFLFLHKNIYNGLSLELPCHGSS